MPPFDMPVAKTRLRSTLTPVARSSSSALTKATSLGRWSAFGPWKPPAFQMSNSPAAPVPLG